MISPGASVDPSVEIVGYSSASPRRLEIGFGSYLGPGCKIAADEVVIGEYTTIHRNTLVAGGAPVSIGHACWIGEGTILNAAERLDIGDGVGIGAGSQLWTHIKHGDVLQGCRWNSAQPLTVGTDAWFVGHCLVSPVEVGARSMAMLGSVVTKDMLADHCYAGAPARDLTDRLGAPFAPTTLDERQAGAVALFEEFAALEPELARQVAIRRSDADLEHPDGVTEFSVDARAYRPTRSAGEVAFVRFLVGRTVKFFPRSAD